jgi:hypothetical protein
MNDVKVLEQINLAKIQKEVSALFSKIGNKNIEQISLQAPEKTDNWKMWYNKSIGKVESLEALESDYTFPIFSETELINEYMEKYNLFRTRLMKLNPRTTLSWHRDYTPRVHIPVFTNKSSFMVLKKKMYYLQAGNLYWVNTMVDHTAINCDTTTRWHIVGCVQE